MESSAAFKKGAIEAGFLRRGMKNSRRRLRMKNIFSDEGSRAADIRRSTKNHKNHLLATRAFQMVLYWPKLIRNDSKDSPKMAKDSKVKGQ